MPRRLRMNAKQYVLERFEEEDPESYFKYKVQSSHGLSHDEMEFLEALNNNSVNVVKSFLNRGLDPNYTILPKRNTPLHVAVFRYDPHNPSTEKIIRALLFFGSDPNAQDDLGNTPLHTACFSQEGSSCAEWLIQAGADVNFTNWNHETPLMCACSLKEPCPDTVKLLLDNGAETGVSNKENQNVLHSLCCADLCRPCHWGDRAKVATRLLEHGLPSNSVDAKGKTPLCYELLRLVYFFNTDDTPQAEIPSLFPAVTQVALSLVAGGGIMDLDLHKQDLMSLIGTMYLFPHARPVIQSFFLSIRNVVSIGDYETVCQWLSSPTHTYFTSRGFTWEGGDTFILRHNLDPAMRLGRRPDDEGNGGGDAVIQNGNGASAAAAAVVIQSRDGAATSPAAVVVEAGDDVMPWSQPPPLLSCCKIVIRKCLGGRLIHTVSYLGLPNKMESFIKSLD